MFRTVWVSPLEDSCVCSMLRFTCIDGSSLVDRRESLDLLPTRLLTPIHVKHTILHTKDEPTMFETCMRHPKLNINL